MAEGLRYSDGANDIRARMLRVDVVVKVEGEADIYFWRLIFKEFDPHKTYTFEWVGSKESLKPYCQKIVDGSLTSVIVAMDSDFEIFGTYFGEHGNILRTKGYSMENTVISERAIIDILESHLINDSTEYVGKLDRECELLKPFVMSEYRNTLGENPPGFYYYKKSDLLLGENGVCPTRVANELKNIEIVPLSCSLAVKDCIQGHFLERIVRLSSNMF